MEDYKDIGELFRDKLKNHTIEPSNKVWENISNNKMNFKANKSFNKWFIGGAAIVISAIIFVGISLINNNINNNANNNNTVSESNKHELNTINNTNISNENNIGKNIINPDNQINKSTNQNNNNSITTTQKNIAENKNQNNNYNINNPFSNSILSLNYNETSEKNSDNKNSNDLNPKIIIGIAPIFKSTSHLNISGDTIICLNQGLTLRAKGGLSVLWSNGSVADEITILPISQEQELTYSAIITTTNGDTNIFIKVKVVDCENVIIPNAFTPDNDGNNDVFTPIFKESITDFTFMIMSRNGSVVFESKDIQKGWDGTFKGTNATEGVYIYLIHYRDNTGKITDKRGQVVLIRKD